MRVMSKECISYLKTKKKARSILFSILDEVRFARYTDFAGHIPILMILSWRPETTSKITDFRKSS